jgi:hypothetical protein
VRRRTDRGASSPRLAPQLEAASDPAHTTYPAPRRAAPRHAGNLAVWGGLCAAAMGSVTLLQYLLDRRGPFAPPPHTAVHASSSTRRLTRPACRVGLLPLHKPPQPRNPKPARQEKYAVLRKDAEHRTRARAAAAVGGGFGAGASGADASSAGAGGGAAAGRRGGGGLKLTESTLRHHEHAAAAAVAAADVGGAAEPGAEGSYLPAVDGSNGGGDGPNQDVAQLGGGPAGQHRSRFGGGRA